MLGTERLIAFIATKDAVKAREFYVDTLGLGVMTEDEYAIALDANGTMVRIQKVETLTPAPYTSLGWRVKNLTKTIAALRAKGVTFERYAWLEQDQHDVWRAPGGAGIAWFKDPDGNTLSLTEWTL